MKSKVKTMVAFRLKKEVASALTAISKRSGKTKTRIMEEAILMHAKELAA